MKKLIIICFVLLLTNNFILGQTPKLPQHAQMQVDCKTCHICDTPTKTDPCLIACPRFKEEVIRHSPEEGPSDIIIDKFPKTIDLYSPVNFSHRSHSEMSLMSGGCGSCHHYNPPGKIVSCETCHEVERTRTNISRPDLKAAYHRQCINCHSTWEEKVECVNCHTLNSQSTAKSVEPIKESYRHPQIAIPEKIIYETDTDEGKLVTFFHNEHNSLFNLDCSTCHSQESCVNCHNQKVDFSKAEKDIHERCSSCHDTENNCNKCHQNSESKPFNHKSKTGFALEDFHSKVACVSCHGKSSKFTGLNKNCVSCHKTKDGIFNHRITGVILDEVHVDLECSDCHKNNNYKLKPVCNDCHDDYKYPNEIPGERVK